LLFSRHSSVPAFLILGTAAGAYPDEPQRAVVATAASVSMDQAVKMAEQRFKARVVRAEAQHEGIHTVYILKLLNDAGHVWTVRVDATNGAIL
jgi:uncharacterized membrane protein YkoI